ncbi:MAG: MmgE/PrpD family protein [Chloroflexi bacterium]|nr:MmgE/PrpD family protein [Chloroflexota bacterium]
MGETKKLARFLAELKYADLNTAVIDKTKDLILDQFGIQIASSTQPWSVIVYNYVKDFGGKPESTIVNYGDKLRAENVAFANATFGHGFEMDDTYFPGNVHLGAIVVAAALAYGEKKHIDGKTFLLAVVAGYEAMGRVGRSVTPSCHARRGCHATGMAGPFGSAAVVGKMSGFNSDLMLNALSVAGSQSSGLLEYTQTGGSVKRTHAGNAAANGIKAAILAEAGITGPPTILEGKCGFCQAYSDGSYKLNELTRGFGTEWVVLGTAYKRHCCCMQIQAPVDATMKLVKENKIKPDDIDQIIMGTNKHALDSVGTILEPEDITASQFSAPFTLAMCVVKGGAGFRHYTEANLRDPEIKKLARRVKLEIDPDVEAAYPLKRAIRVTIKLKNGKSVSHFTEGAKGTPEDPMNREEVTEKFTDLATTILPTQRASKIAKIVAALEDVKDVSELAKLMVA